MAGAKEGKALVTLIYKVTSGEYKMFNMERKMRFNPDDIERVSARVASEIHTMLPSSAMCCGEGCGKSGDRLASVHFGVGKVLRCFFGSHCGSRECTRSVTEMCGIKDAKALDPSVRKKAHCRLCNELGVPNWCGQCQAMVYCSRECQVKDWPRHKKECVKKTKSDEKTEAPDLEVSKLDEA